MSLPSTQSRAVGLSTRHCFPQKPLLTWHFLSSDQASSQASRLCHLAPVAEMPVSLMPQRPRQGDSGCVLPASSRVGLLAQLLSWEQMSGRGSVVPTRAGLGQLHCVNGRHLPSHQEGELGSFRGREGRGEVKKAAGGKSSFLLSLQLLCTRDPPPLPTEPPPPPIYGFSSASSSVIMD